MDDAVASLDVRGNDLWQAMLIYTIGRDTISDLVEGAVVATNSRGRFRVGHFDCLSALEIRGHDFPRNDMIQQCLNRCFGIVHQGCFQDFRGESTEGVVGGSKNCRKRVATIGCLLFIK